MKSNDPSKILDVSLTIGAYFLIRYLAGFVTDESNFLSAWLAVVCLLSILFAPIFFTIINFCLLLICLVTWDAVFLKQIVILGCMTFFSFNIGCGISGEIHIRKLKKEIAEGSK